MFDFSRMVGVRDFVRDSCDSLILRDTLQSDGVGVACMRGIVDSSTAQAHEGSRWNLVDTLNVELEYFAFVSVLLQILISLLNIVLEMIFDDILTFILT